MTHPIHNGEPLRVSSQSNPSSLAGAIAGILRESRGKGRVEVTAIGAGAVNQAVKGIAIARGYVAPSGFDLVAIPGFLDLEVAGEERTALRFFVEAR